MANLRVTLVRLCKTPGGWKRYNVAFDKQGHVKPNRVIVRGREREYPVGHYELRRYVGRRTKYENVGDDPAKALEAFHIKSQLLQGRETEETDVEETRTNGVWVSLPKSGLDRVTEIARDEGVPLSEWVSFVIAQKIKDVDGGKRRL